MFPLKAGLPERPVLPPGTGRASLLLCGHDEGNWAIDETSYVLASATTIISLSVATMLGGCD